MREFRFRAWDGVKMFYPDSLMFNIKGQPTTAFQHHNLPSGEGVLLNGGFTKDLRLMQYTGLKDKNGVEIFEGDILQTDKGRGKITWEEAQYWLECEDTWPYNLRLAADITRNYEVGYDTSEVIGNIYENPELLEAK